MKTIYYVLNFTSILLLLFIITNPIYCQNNDTCKSKSTPIFPSAYIAEGIITISNVTIEQPFQVWHDSNEGIHRQDYYKGMLTTLNVKKENEIRSYNFFPVYTKTLKNQVFCNTSILDKGSKLDSFLPDLSNHYHCGEEIIQGIKTEKWCNETNLRKKTVYVELRNSSSSESHEQISVAALVMITTESNRFSGKTIFTKFSDSKPDVKFLTEPLKKVACVSSKEFDDHFQNLSRKNMFISLVNSVEFNPQPEDYSDLPESFDWRERGAVSKVKDQAADGPCWSFAATAAIESAYLIRTNGTKKMDLSEQAALDCTWDFGSTAHYGGLPESVFWWMIQHGGFPTEEQYGPYLAKGGYCHAEKVNLTASISGWGFLPFSFANNHNRTVLVKAALKRYGPLVAVMYGNTSSFINYSKSHGIYNDPECKTKLGEMNHAVLLVGYGKQNQTSYWIVKNSWGSYWGDQGYAYVAMENNVCGLMNRITFVII